MAHASRRGRFRPAPARTRLVRGLCLALAAVTGLGATALFLQYGAADGVQPVDILRAGAILCEAKGDLASASSLARAVLERQPDDADMRLLLARQFLATRHPAAVREAKSILRDLCRTPNSSAALPSWANSLLVRSMPLPVMANVSQASSLPKH